jgi:hypothetical protein
MRLFKIAHVNMILLKEKSINGNSIVTIAQSRINIIWTLNILDWSKKDQRIQESLKEFMKYLNNQY